MIVMVIGAGIGGLTAALSLNAAGFDVRIYVSAADIKVQAARWARLVKASGFRAAD
jgi:2-polyprenyl-6-methoxyphenol hydroxylase-like FAD-dependent oxidoreductase